MNKKSALFDIYPYDPATNTITIPVRLNSYADLYNPIDPSPAPSRDLSQDVVDYLLQCSSEVDLEYKIGLSIQIIQEDRDDHNESEGINSIRNFFTHEIFLTNNQIRRSRAAALKHLAVSLTCLTIYVLSEQVHLDGILFDIIKEAILIGGWVFMWESVTHNFIQIDPINEEIKRFDRLISAPIRFHYKNS